MKLRAPLKILFAICACLPALLRGQSATSIQQFDRSQNTIPLPRVKPLNLSTNTEAPELYPGENTDVGPQRILRLKPHKTYFEIIADSQYFYTDNALLSDKTKTGTALFVNTIQGALAPEAYKLGTGQFSPMMGFRSQWFNYDLESHNDGLNRLDFNAQTAFISGRQEWGNWQLFGGLDFTRILDQHAYTEGYREYVPAVALQRFFVLNDNLIFVAGMQFSYHFTRVPPSQPPPFFVTRSEVNDRENCLVNLSLIWAIIPKLVLQPYYRFQYFHYPKFTDGTQAAIPRDDTVHTFGGSAAYYFTKSVALRAFTSYEIQDSSFASTFNYHKLDAGGGLSLDFRF
jgi:hypothetical protein